MDPEALRAWRAEHGLSRAAASVLLGLTERSIENLEYGRSPQSALWGVLAKLVPLVKVPAHQADAAERRARIGRTYPLPRIGPGQ